MAKGSGHGSRTYDEGDPRVCQADLNEANTTKVIIEVRVKTVEDQVADLQWQVQKLQYRTKENRAATNRVAELEVELQETVAGTGRCLSKVKI